MPLLADFREQLTLPGCPSFLGDSCIRAHVAQQASVISCTANPADLKAALYRVRKFGTPRKQKPPLRKETLKAPGSLVQAFVASIKH